MPKTKSHSKVPISEGLFRQITPFKMRKGDLRKLEIVHAALECISTMGFERLSYEAVGEKCGLKRSHVAYYFPDKNDLVIAAIKLAYATSHECIVEELRTAGSRKDRVFAYVKGVVNWLERHHHHRAVVALLPYLAVVSDTFREINREFKEISIGRMASIFDLPQKSAAAETLSNILYGEVMDWTTHKTKVPSKEFVSQTTKTILAVHEKVR